ETLTLRQGQTPADRLRGRDPIALLRPSYGGSTITERNTTTSQRTAHRSTDEFPWGATFHVKERR
ncbi:hypothetical protein, partial [Actinomadura alba]|uniref:hypothetical protein n=1 Tax=Actinomadura alba TaxID=406431 RepID=UPI001C9C8C0C